MAGSIPAGAGEAWLTWPDTLKGRVYPRGRGGSYILQNPESKLTGLSPRARGKLPEFRPAPYICGSIPAGAGEAFTSGSTGSTGWVYPRGRGGSGGSTKTACFPMGLSPRARGKQCCKSGRGASEGSIPAGAGEAQYLTSVRSRRWVYPRGRGGSTDTFSRCFNSTGLSPRARGKPPAGGVPSMLAGSIPAGAGEARNRTCKQGITRVYPRGRGGSRPQLFMAFCKSGLSPRARGKQHGISRRLGIPGSIPAGAGEAQCWWLCRQVDTVYPRGRGGSDKKEALKCLKHGLSPRARGKPDRDIVLAADQGSIPAGAGEAQGISQASSQPWVYPRGRGGSITSVTS